MFEIFANTKKKNRWTVIAVVSKFCILFFVHHVVILDNKNFFILIEKSVKTHTVDRSFTVYWRVPSNHCPLPTHTFYSTGANLLILQIMGMLLDPVGDTCFTDSWAWFCHKERCCTDFLIRRVQNPHKEDVFDYILHVKKLGLREEWLKRMELSFELLLIPKFKLFLPCYLMNKEVRN